MSLTPEARRNLKIIALISIIAFAGVQLYRLKSAMNEYHESQDAQKASSLATRHTISRIEESSAPSPIIDNSPSGLLSQAKIFMNAPMSNYDAAEAKKRLEQIPKTAPEYKEAQQLLAQVKIRPAPAPTATPELVEEFPDAFIREKLRRDYPDDYITQKGVYDMQRESYEFMRNLPDSKIKSKVRRDYPNDFVTQKGVYEMQVEAKSAMDKP